MEIYKATQIVGRTRSRLFGKSFLRPPILTENQEEICHKLLWALVQERIGDAEIHFQELKAESLKEKL